MDRWRSLSRIARSGLLVCSLVCVAALGMAGGIAWLWVPAALATLGAAAAAVGVDSRAPGDWHR
jgi:hypothetical protein